MSRENDELIFDFPQSYNPKKNRNKFVMLQFLFSLPPATCFTRVITTGKSTPAIGQMSHIRPQSFVIKLQAKNPAVTKIQ